MIWTVIIFSGIITYTTRFLPLSNFMPKKLPRFIQQGLEYVSIAVLTPITSPLRLNNGPPELP